jgi:SRSO17 transposase
VTLNLDVSPRVFEKLRLSFTAVQIRNTERGTLSYKCAARRVWTLEADDEDAEPRQEWLFCRREHDGSLTYSFSNAAPEVALATLARWRSERYFIERTFQDAKTEAGWADFRARKYRAWVHHTALTALALWFMVDIKLHWRKRFPPDPDLSKQLGLDVLPAISTASIRTLLAAALPLPRLTPDDARALIAKHLVRRSRSTRSRLRNNTEKPS